MIINSLSASPEFAFYCNGRNDDTTLVTFIANLRARGFSNFTIKIHGSFIKAANAAVTIDNSSYTQITLDFSNCNRITSNGAFLNVNNVRVINCAVYHQAGAANVEIYTFTGNNAIFENCRITGAFTSGACRGFSVTDSRLINCETEITNNSGSLYGIYATNSIIDNCYIYAKSLTASAYAIEAITSMVSNCNFKGETNSTDTTASGNGGIGGGYYSNCVFIGIGALKGQGFYVRANYWLAANNCIFRGYTRNTSTGWGIGLTGQAADGTTLSLIGINCNQVALSGYSQTKSMEFTAGYGAYIGLFYAVPSVVANIRSLASWNRNRT